MGGAYWGGPGAAKGEVGRICTITIPDSRPDDLVGEGGGWRASRKIFDVKNSVKKKTQEDQHSSSQGEQGLEGIWGGGGGKDWERALLVGRS